MSSGRRSERILVDLFSTTTVTDLAGLCTALGGASTATARRYLARIPYRRSYNHNGKYYALHDPSRYDRHGLWSCGDVHFSSYGSLRSTVRTLVGDADVGMTHRELEELLRVRVHNTLLGLVRSGEVARERLVEVFVYLHVDRDRRAEQMRRRQELGAAAVASEDEFDDVTAIRVLLALLRFPGSQPADVVRRLGGHAPPIRIERVRAVFARYALGEKGGARIF